MLNTDFKAEFTAPLQIHTTYYFKATYTVIQKPKAELVSFKRVLIVTSIKILFRLSNKNTLERT